MLLLVPRAFAAEWVHLSSARGEIPTPNDDGAEQVNALIFDVDLDGRNDFVVGERRGAPGVVWFRRDSDSFTRFPIEMNQADVTSSAAFYDLDRDGDLDVIMGGSHLSDEIWWWENPFPEYDASTPWTRHTIKRSGGKQHHDIIIGDFDSDGADELAFWSLVPEHELHIGMIPDDPRAGPWSFSLVHSTGDQYSEGLVSVDVDLDGRLDVVAGGYWLKHTSDLSFDAHEIAPSRSHARVAAGDIVTGGRPEVVFVDGHGKGPLEWHEWSEEAEAWIAHTLVEEVERGHSLIVADVNGDGFDDIFVAEMRQNGGNSDAKMWIFYGDGTGSFETELVSTGIGTHGSPLGDLDGDGDLDILGVPFNWDVPRVDLWLQNGTDTSARPRLIRGDADADGSVQVNDAIVMLRVLFLFDPIPSCLEALDVNESGEVDLSDPIATLILLFRPDMEPLRPLVGECEPLREGALSCDGFAPCDEPPLAVR